MNPLLDLIPPKWRKYVYAAVSVAALVFAAWQASDGNWGTFVAALVPTFTSALAASNTAVQDPDNFVDGHATEPAEPDEVPFPG